MSDLHQGAVQPEDYKLKVLTGDSGLDMSTVSAAVFVVEKPDGTVVTWASSISGQTTTELTMTHVFQPITTEVDLAGVWRLYGRLTVPGGSYATDRIEELVRAQFEVNE